MALKGLDEAEDCLTQIDLNVRSEKKPGCLAIHWRGLKEQDVKILRKQVEPRWTSVAQQFGLNLKEFDGGLELRVPGRNKGDAGRVILEEMGRDTFVCYLGDDLTDEDAFKSIKGKGVGILVRKEYRPTAADIWLVPPEELLEFLWKWVVAYEK
jgi:trehalose-phosphatase